MPDGMTGSSGPSPQQTLADALRQFESCKPFFAQIEAVRSSLDTPADAEDPLVQSVLIDAGKRRDAALLAFASFLLNRLAEHMAELAGYRGDYADRFGQIGNHLRAFANQNFADFEALSQSLAAERAP